MKALEVTNKSVTREALLKMAEKVPGAWIGLRIAAMLLLLEGWKSTHIARLFGLTRWSVVKWIQRINAQGLDAMKDVPRPGRPSRLSTQIQQVLEEVLQKNPRSLGLKRNRWDGIVVVEYLERVHGLHVKVRQAQRWIRRLGFSLRQPIYRYVQATEEGVKEFRQTLKKTPRPSEK
jgi:transposase